MAMDLDPFSHPYTDEEIAHLEMRSRDEDLRVNRQLFPDRYAPQPKMTVTETLNNLPGEFLEGHIPADIAAEIAEMPGSAADYVNDELPQRSPPTVCKGYDDAPEDVRQEVEPLTVEELKAELDAISVAYEKGDHKADLRNKLAVAWAAM